MQKNNRNLIIFKKQKRWMRLWQVFFTGWGMVMVIALIAGALFSKQLLWTPITAINLKEINSNQFNMTNAEFNGTDKNSEPFRLYATNVRQEYETPDIISFVNIKSMITRVSDGVKIRDNITAKSGVYSREKKTMTLRGNVRVNSSNGDKVLTDELVILL